MSLNEKKKEKKIKLNLGSGKDYRNPEEGWVNVEINPIFKADVYADMRDLDYPEGSISEIFISHALDHITFSDAKRLIRKCHRWLEEGGKIDIRTPNMEVLCQLALNRSHHALRCLYGSDGEDSSHHENNIIRWAYSPKSLRGVLETFGFKVVASVESAGFALEFMMVAIKREEE